ncbi:methyltransferase domain-containing protein [Agrobacterium tumefaciens]|uniref:methyltransferase domain-containing protein n=2 Tax=Agrobacterium tumefaciens TaxID=358 RepID=UPI0029345614|nr:methyltransferase domain-containing protein [Agrobacterium tumefaciens]
MTKSDTDVSWYEESPHLSLSLLRDAGLEPGMSVVDIGGGASRLVDMLVSEQQDHVTVLDLSSAALELAAARLPASAYVSWIASDISAWVPDLQYDF